MIKDLQLVIDNVQDNYLEKIRLVIDQFVREILDSLDLASKDFVKSLAICLANSEFDHS